MAGVPVLTGKPTLSNREATARSGAGEHRGCRQNKTTMNTHFFPFPVIRGVGPPIRGVFSPGPTEDWPVLFYHAEKVVVNLTAAAAGDVVAISGIQIR